MENLTKIKNKKVMSSIKQKIVKPCMILINELPNWMMISKSIKKNWKNIIKILNHMFNKKCIIWLNKN